MRKSFFVSLILIFTVLKALSQSAGYTEWYLRTPDSLGHANQDIYVREINSGSDTVIVIHGGFGANHDYMLDAIKGLETKYHFVLYDQRGSLLSPAPKEKLTFQKNVNDLDLLVNQLGCKKVKIIAHSMGTLVAMEYAKQHPDKVSNIVLVGAIFTKSDGISDIFSNRVAKQTNFLTSRKEARDLPIWKKYEMVKGNNANNDDLQANFSSDRERSDFYRLVFALTNIYKIDRYKLTKGGFHFFNVEASQMAETVNWKFDYREVLDKNGKTTIINGDFDFIDFNGELHKELIKNYNRIKFKLIKNAGHNIWIDEPELFRKELDKALKN